MLATLLDLKVNKGLLHLQQLSISDDDPDRDGRLAEQSGVSFLPSGTTVISDERTKNSRKYMEQLVLVWLDTVVPVNDCFEKCMQTSPIIPSGQDLVKQRSI